MKEILQKDEALLRKSAREVKPEEISSEYIRGVIRDMKGAMDKEEDAAAIAAPQIGELVRIFIISKHILPNNQEGLAKDLVFINPKLIKHSKKTKVVEEGCLSVRWLYGDVERFEKATVEAYDENGKRIVYGASGVIAQAFQHELDHLDGVLFIDKADNVRDIPPESQSEDNPKELLHD
ncbi:MAG: peptide deformylase [Candidatus Campbellbacteria bacterium]|nr:peptide deformylase [Candidatus Campbellbacteria bacterium]